MTRFTFVCLAAGLLLACVDAAASATPAVPGADAVLSEQGGMSKNNDAGAIRAQQLQLRAEAGDPKGRFKDLNDRRRVELARHQTLVLDLLEGAERTTDLSAEDQMAVFNSLEAIEAILNSAEDDRMICERSKPVGSNRPKVVCLTVAERRAQKEVTEKALRGDQQCVGNGCR